MTFFLSAGFGLFGALVTLIFLPDTTGLSLDELDRLVGARRTGFRVLGTAAGSRV
jgi:hypothetical protein